MKKTGHKKETADAILKKRSAPLLVILTLWLSVTGCRDNRSSIEKNEFVLLGQAVADHTIELLPDGGTVYVIQPTEISSHPDRPDLEWLKAFRKVIKKSSSIRVIDIQQIPLSDLYVDIREQSEGWQVSSVQDTTPSNPPDLLVSFTGPPAEIPTGHWLGKTSLISVSPTRPPGVSRLKHLYQSGLLMGVYVPTRVLLMDLNDRKLKKGELGDYYRYIAPPDIQSLPKGMFEDVR